MKRGLFIAIEGPDGSGKSTFARRLEQEIAKKGIHSITTREPGGTAIGEKIRYMLLNPENEEMANRTEALLYAAARAQHVDEVIRPAIEAGKVVLCERFILSSLAYQGVGRDLGLEEVRAINLFAVDGCMPDVTLFFDVDPVVSMNRKEDEKDRLEAVGDAFHRRVFDGYKMLMQQEENIVIIDANQSPDAVFQEAMGHVLACMEKRDLK